MGQELTVATTETRSRIMAAVRGRDTKPEMLLRRRLHAEGLRYRISVRGLPGSPDVVFPQYRAVVFVHGCFWHRHTGCSKATTPKSNEAFWQAKFKANVVRDRKAVAALHDLAWRVGIVWQCAIGHEVDEDLVREICWFVRFSDAWMAEWPSIDCLHPPA